VVHPADARSIVDVSTVTDLPDEQHVVLFLPFLAASRR
jgi:hypothetical protein